MTSDGAFGAALRAAFDRMARPGARSHRRVAQAAWSAGIALLLLLGSVLEPVDQFVWLVQSRIAGHRPSGDIVFVSTDDGFAAQGAATSRSKLAAALNALDREGVGQVFLDIPLEAATVHAEDAPLRQAIADLGPRLVVVDRSMPDIDGRMVHSGIAPSIAGRAQRVLFDHHPNYLGFTWNDSWQAEYGGTRYRTLSAALAGMPAAPGSFAIDYGIRLADIPRMSIDRLVSGGPAPALAGKAVVIAQSGADKDLAATIPGAPKVPASYVAIYAAETLKAGRTGYVKGLVMVPLLAILLAACGWGIASRRRRWLAYAGLVGSLVLAVQLGAALGIRGELAYPAALLGVYGLLRSRTRWQDRAALFDPETGMPTLRALEDWIGRNRDLGGHVVIARIHGYEHVLRTLRSADHAAYTLKLADRLRAVDKDLSLYCTGHYFGWHSPSDDAEALVDHLTGLRAIFAAPVQVGEHTVDVGITFGLARIDGDPAGRIAAAIAAVEETDEAVDPVRVASAGSEMDLLWDISLRARIDEAMEAGEIYCVYQPKIDIVAGQMIGVEALVRWHDPAKGFIPPMHFIQQCEKAGRMEHLTRYVLQSACSAGKLLHFRNQPISMSVNISATLLTDMRICGIVRNVLQATGFDPHFLMLEVTETARITHFEVAATVLGELRALGIRISMDDFGVGAANYETFFELPFDEIKVDRLFVANALRDVKARAIVASIVAMGREARIAVVAEGAESVGDIEMLLQLGCRQVQGFALSRPLSLSNLLEFKLDSDGKALRNIV